MAKDKFRSTESMGKIIKSRMELMKTWDKKDALAIMLPQRVEDNILYNFRNDVIGGCDGKDVIFHEDASIIEDTTRITEKFLTSFYAPMDAYFGEAASDDVEEEEDVVETSDEDEILDDVKPSKKDKKEDDEIVSENLLDEVIQLIEAGELKKAKKLLKKNEDHEDYKACKKLIKKAKGE